jgi:lipopolysaccharide export system protein LptA
MRLRTLIPLALTGLVMPSAFSAGTARQEPIKLRADRIEIDQKTGVSRYRGHVRFNQGTLQLTADHAEVRSRGNTLESVVAEGKPTTFRERPEGQLEFIEGQATRVEYDALQQKVHLYGDVDIRHGRDNFRAGVAHYDMTTETLHAERDATQRVQAALTPGTEDVKEVKP